MKSQTCSRSQWDNFQSGVVSRVLCIKINVINESLENFKISISKKINKISINSKEIEKNDLFVGLKVKIKNGYIFEDNAIKNGALFSVIDKDYTKKFKDKKIKVKNTFNFFFKNC